MAFAAGRHQVGLVDRRARIDGRQYLVRPVAIPAPRRLHVTAQRAQLRVERIPVGRKLVRMARPANRRRLHAERRFSRLQNRVRRVAVRAYRRLHIAAGHGLAVRPMRVVVVDLRVAAPARLRNVRLVRRALRICVAQDVVRSVAALAIGRHQQAFLAQRESVNRVHVQRIHARQPVLLRHALSAVAVAAGLRHIQRIHRRTRVRLRKNRVRVPVAARARMLLRVRMNAA